MKYEVDKFMPVIYNLLLISSVRLKRLPLPPHVRFEPKQETQEDKGTLKTHFRFFSFQ